MSTQYSGIFAAVSLVFLTNGASAPAATVVEGNNSALLVGVFNGNPNLSDFNLGGSVVDGSSVLTSAAQPIGSEVNDLFTDGSPSDGVIVLRAAYNSNYRITADDQTCLITPNSAFMIGVSVQVEVNPGTDGSIVILHDGVDNSDYYSTTINYKRDSDGKFECSSLSSPENVLK